MSRWEILWRKALRNAIPIPNCCLRARIPPVTTAHWSTQPRKDRRSALSCSLCVAVRPWDAPGYTFRVEFLTSFEEARPVVAATVVGDATITVGCQKKHLRFPTVRTQRLPVTEYDGLPRSPVLVADMGAVFGGDCVHAMNPHIKADWWYGVLTPYSKNGRA